jgi:putative peptidoglycan lipid II flippase
MNFMMRRFLNIIGKEISGLHEAAYLLGAFAVGSQILALIRDRLLAYKFGATSSQVVDLYYAAFRIPDFIFVAIASMVSISVLIPFLMEKIDSGEAEAKEFIDAVFSVFFAIIGSVGVIAWLAAPYLIRVFFPTFIDNHDTLTAMTRIMLLSPIFLGFSNFLASITQIYKRFFIYAISPIVYNVGIIVGIVFLYPVFGITGLAWGVALGAFLHFFIQIPFVWQKSLFPRLHFPVKIQPVKKVVLISLPRTITISSNEIAKFFLIAIAAVLGTGAISIFHFAWNLQSVPLSIIGVSYSLAAFPVLTKLFTSGEQQKFVEQIVISTKHILFWSIPIMILFIVLRAQIVRVILGAGAFNWEDTRLTAAALAMFTLSLIPQSLTALFVRAYYSRGDTRRPLAMNIFSAACIVGCAYLFVYIFQHVELFRYFIEDLFRIDDIPGAVILMLPLGFSVGATINMVLHWIAFEKDFRGYTRSVMRSLFQVLSSSIIMGTVTYWFLGVFDHYFDIHTFSGVFFQGFLAGIIGIMVFILLLILMGNKELFIIARTLKHKIWKAKVIPADPSGV